MGTDLGQNVYKIRLAIRGTSKGNPVGQRVIRYVKIVKQTVILAEIYLKSDFDTVDVGTVIKRLTEEHFL